MKGDYKDDNSDPILQLLCVALAIATLTGIIAIGIELIQLLASMVNFF